MKENGIIIKCMEKVSISGEMEENMMVNIIMIKSMDLAYIFGLMEEDMKVSGDMVDKMEKAGTLRPMALLGLDCGKMVEELDG